MAKMEARANRDVSPPVRVDSDAAGGGADSGSEAKGLLATALVEVRTELEAKPCPHCGRRRDAEQLAALTRLLWVIVRDREAPKKGGSGALKGKTTKELIELARQLPEFAELLADE